MLVYFSWFSWLDKQFEGRANAVLYIRLRLKR